MEIGSTSVCVFERKTPNDGSINVRKHIISNKVYNGCWLLKNAIKRYYYYLRNRMRLNSTHVDYSKDIMMNGKVIISNCGRIHIGNSVVINSGDYPNPVGTSLTKLYTQNSSSIIHIGNNVGISSALIFADNEIWIEDNVLIGAETMIVDNDFHGLVYKSDIGRTEMKGGEKILIKEGAFIGTRCLILKGVTIGKGAVVGAGSVVTKDIPDGEIWAGNPAKFIRNAE